MDRNKDRRRNRWVAKVKTDSTHPPKGLFTKSAPVIAKTLASHQVSPKGPASGLRMLTYFINRGGHNLSPARRAQLERAKELLSQRLHGRVHGRRNARGVRSRSHRRSRSNRRKPKR